ncbi:unannotated protein [freshwater metagenome]|uniref:Unannotated protein n=1 Tax=freshwater metagenome TaxID=449393 RepID=A0A6J5YZZ5_9ZZZZ
MQLLQHDRVALIQLDRPKMNVLSRQMQDDIAQVCAEVTKNPRTRAVVFWGGDHNFAAGADVKEMVHWDLATARAQAPGLHSAFDAVAALEVPTIAAITGYALGGGCELALACDMRIAAENATLGQPEILLGIIPGAGGTQRLSRLVGPSQAKDLIFTGRFVLAPEALEMGLVNEVVAPDRVLARAMELAARLSFGPKHAMAAAKKAIDVGLGLELAQGLELEQQLFAELFGTTDQVTGMQSFIEHGPGKAEFE